MSTNTLAPRFIDSKVLNGSVVEKKPLSKPKSKLSSYLKILCAAFLFIALAIQLGIRISILKRAYIIEQLRVVALDKDNILRDLRSEYAEMIRPGALQIRARGELSMIEGRDSLLRRGDSLK